MAKLQIRVCQLVPDGCLPEELAPILYAGGGAQWRGNCKVAR